jgi:deoxyribodipyrimidine photo-lyase
MLKQIVIFWFRRDLRLQDNHGLYDALKYGFPVLPLFIFDSDILNKLQTRNDARISFIYNQLVNLHAKLLTANSSLLIKHGNPTEVFGQLLQAYQIKAVFTNHDYEPYAIGRDDGVRQLLEHNGVVYRSFKDQVIFEKNEVVKNDGKPYTVFTPYARRWKESLSSVHLKTFQSELLLDNFLKQAFPLPSLKEIGFEPSPIEVLHIQDNPSKSSDYESKRNFPYTYGTTHAGPHLRFGTISVRELANKALAISETYLNELIWREFFMQILWHFPEVVSNNFNPRYKHLQWRNNEDEFRLWCEGKTGYPLVDAGMRQLNETGFMHNRVRMVAASFLCKHLLIDWQWGEAWFASKLLDYELASNNGNWQWAAGTGCDAAPYFRVFNPTEQAKKFDPQEKYVRKWIPELNTNAYLPPVVDHSFARNRAIQAYKEALRLTAANPNDQDQHF